MFLENLEIEKGTYFGVMQEKALQTSSTISCLQVLEFTETAYIKQVIYNLAFCSEAYLELSQTSMMESLW